MKRELWGNRFTAADRRKFAGPVQEVLERHHTIELWNIARSTPTPNQCIVEVAYAVGLINDSRRESLMKFECDGDGTGFLWKKIPQPKIAKAAKRRKQ